MTETGQKGRRVAVALGEFDGVHRGHRAVVEAARRALGAAGGEVRVVTFWPHVLAVLRGDGGPELLTTERQKERLLKAAGADAVDAWRFDRALAGMPAEEFWEKLKGAVDGLAAVATGDNFRFGAGAAGDAGLLGRLAARDGVAAVVAPRVEWGGAAVSSSRVREAVRGGDMAAAAAMLGRAFSLEGEVVHGRAVGRTRGLPTVNVKPDLAIRPLPGVYAARVKTAAGGEWAAGAFVPDADDGRQAVFGGVAEAHLLGFDGDLYGTRVELKFGRRLRGFRPFGGEAEASAAIRRDLEEVERENERFAW